MLRNSNYLEGCSIGATDGTIGEVKDLFFDDPGYWQKDEKRAVVERPS